MAVAARVDPKTLFAPDEWAPLARRSSWKGLALIAHAWGVIALAVAMAVVWPLTIPLAIAIIGARQLGLAILMHDAAHGALHPSLAVNDWAGDRLTTGGLQAYRTYHLGHHKYAQQAEDPDLVLSAPFPITPMSLRRKIIRDLTGQTYYKLRWSTLVKRIASRPAGEPLWPILKGAVWQRRRFFTGMVVTVALTAPSAFGGCGRRCGWSRRQPGCPWSPGCATSPSTPAWVRTSPTRSVTPAPPGPTGWSGRSSRPTT